MGEARLAPIMFTLGLYAYLIIGGMLSATGLIADAAETDNVATLVCLSPMFIAVVLVYALFWIKRGL